MDKMFYIKGNRDVEVYSYDVANKNALCYSPNPNNGLAWEIIKMNKLIPYPHANIYKRDNFSKTIYNKAKSRLKLINAIWQTSDGLNFNHSNIENAVHHELNLMEKENKEVD